MSAQGNEKESFVGTVINLSIVDRVVDELGKFDGKRSNCCSLSTHLLNSLVLGLKYAEFCEGDGYEFDEVEKKLLVSSLLLHDCNKVVNSIYGEDFEYNSDECFDLYFEDDVLGVEDYLCGGDEDIGDYMVDLKYLARSAEDYEETSDYGGDFSHLSDFVSFGDSMASSLGSGDRRESFCVDVNYFDFTPLSQPVLNMVCIHNLADIIRDRGGTVLGYGSDFVAFIGDVSENDIESVFKEKLFSDYIESLCGFGIKAEWNSVSFESLPYVPYGVDRKVSIIAEDYSREILEDDVAGFEPYSPSDEYVENYLAYLVFDLYFGDSDDLALNELESMFKDEEESYGSRKGKISLLEELDDEEYFDLLDEHRSALEGEFISFIDSDFNYGEFIVDEFFGGVSSCSVGPKQCFLCGCGDSSSVELKDYKPGRNSIFSSRSYSRKTEYGKAGKNICLLCSLENDICVDICDNLNSDFVYVFVDDFVADVSLSSDEFINNCFSEDLDSFVNSDSLEYGKIYLPYNVFPCSYGDDSSKIYTIFNTLKLCRNFGVRAVLSSPFTQIYDRDSAFYDYDPIDHQLVLGLYEMDRFEERHSEYMSVERAFDLMGVMEDCSKNDGDRFELLDEDNVEVIFDRFVVNSNRELSEKINKYVDEYHSDRYMKLKDLAEQGVDVYYKQYNSKHSKTKVFRECLESIVEGLSNGMSGEDLVCHVSGQVLSSAEGTTDYDVKEDEVESFVRETIEYLDLYYDLDEVEILDNIDRIVNSYGYAYNRVLNNS